MGACSIGHCIKSYIFDKEVYIQSNTIFRPINTQLNIDDSQLSEEEKQNMD